MILITSFDPDLGLSGAATCPGCGRPARLRGRVGRSDLYGCEGEGCHLVFEVATLDREMRRAPGCGSGGPSDDSCVDPLERAGETIPEGSVNRLHHRDHSMS